MKHEAAFFAGAEEPIPVFLISFNRGAMLERAIAGIRGLSRVTEVIVHDNGSTDAATLAVLDQIEQQGIRVFRHGPINSPDELNKVDETVQAFFAGRSAAQYVVSDCDIDISVADARALDLYDELLDKFPQALHVRHGDVGMLLRRTSPKCRKGALASPGFVLDARPPAQPHSGVVVDHSGRFWRRPYFECPRRRSERDRTRRN